MCGKTAEWSVCKGNTRRYSCTDHLTLMIDGRGGSAKVQRAGPWPKGAGLCCNYWGDASVGVTQQKLADIAAEVVLLVLKKNADYGDAWQNQGVPGLMARVSDKMCRVDRLIDGREVLIESESLRDTLIDGIGYCMLGLLYLEARGCQNTPAKPADLTKPV